MEVTENVKRKLLELLAEWQLPTEFATELFAKSTLSSYPKGGFIFRKGSTADVAFWIVAGLVKVFCPNPDRSRTFAMLAGLEISWE